MLSLNHIIVKEKNDQKITLQNLVDKNDSSGILRWFGKEMYKLIDLEEGADVAEHHVHNMVSFLLSCGVHLRTDISTRDPNEEHPGTKPLPDFMVTPLFDSEE